MSASPVLDAFPRRPIGLVTTPQRRRGRIAGLLLCLVLFGPSLYWGIVRWNEASLRADLREHGVMAAYTGTGEGSCTSRRGRLTGEDTPRGCSFTITYTLRAEEGGGERQAEVYLHGRPPILTPSAWYDPQDPSRVMLRPEIDRDPSWSQRWAPFLLLLLPLVGLLWWWFSGRGGLAKAAASPDPLIAPIEQVPAGQPPHHSLPPSRRATRYGQGLWARRAALPGPTAGARARRPAMGSRPALSQRPLLRAGRGAQGPGAQRGGARRPARRGLGLAPCPASR